MRYIGVKAVDAVPMARTVVGDEGWGGDPKEVEGYQVTYPDGYVSWCPKEAFEKANIPVIVEALTDKVVDDFILEYAFDRSVAPGVMTCYASLRNGQTVVESACSTADIPDWVSLQDRCKAKVRERVTVFLLGLFACAKGFLPNPGAAVTSETHFILPKEFTADEIGSISMGGSATAVGVGAVEVPEAALEVSEGGTHD